MCGACLDACEFARAFFFSILIKLPSSTLCGVLIFTYTWARDSRQMRRSLIDNEQKRKTNIRQVIKSVPVGSLVPIPINWIDKLCPESV